MRGKASLDQRDDLARDGIGFEACPCRHLTRAGRAEDFAVVGIKVPLVTDGLVALPAALHQHAMPLALLAVEVFHAQRFASLGMRREFAHAAEEMAVFAELQRQAVRRGLDRLRHAPNAWRGHHQAVRPQAQNICLQLGWQTAGGANCIKPAVMRRATSGFQVQREVPHRREEQGRTRFARPDVGRFIGHLGHPDGIAPHIETIERGGTEVQLVPQHDDQVAQLSHLQPGRDGRLPSRISPRPSYSPSSAASSWAGRRPRKACSEERPCCRETWPCAQSSRPPGDSRQVHAFLTQAVHQPGPATCLPANSGHPAALSVALP